MPRLFTAIELPDPLRGELGRLKQPLPGARWLEPAEFHLTIRFAGDIDNRLAGEFADFLAAINGNAFELRLRGVGAFGGNDPSVVWVGVEPSAELDQLYRAHDRAARNAGLPPERRGFKPHVTLARLRGAEPERVARFLERHGAFRAPPFVVTRFVLMSSRPNVGGGPYVVEEAYPLTDWSGNWDEDED